MYTTWRLATSTPARFGPRRRGTRSVHAGSVPVGRWRRVLLPGALLCLAALGCTAEFHRRDADRTAYKIIAKKQTEALGRTEPFSIEPPVETLRRRLMLDQHLPHSVGASLGTAAVAPIKQWPDKKYLERTGDAQFVESLTTEAPLHLTLEDTLRIAAHESREYQAQKESVFAAALQLDLERDAFRATWSGVMRTLFQSALQREVALDDKGHTDLQTISGFETNFDPTVTQRIKSGLTFTGALGIDLVSLMTQDRLYSRGLIADFSATLPLLRGAGEFIVSEPLTQAERNVVYAIYAFERFKHTFAVEIASEYLAVLQQYDQVRNAEENYRSLIRSTRRARRLSQAGRLPEIQVDQARQDELRARQRWVAALEQYQRRLDAFKLTLGLSADADVGLDHAELDRLLGHARAMFPAEAAAGSETPAPAADAPVELAPPGEGRAGPYELDAVEAVVTALSRRLDLRIAVGRVTDAQRAVAVAADQLRADVTLLGTGSAGARRTLASVSQPDARVRPDEGIYSVLLTLDPALERTRERNVYRTSLVGFEAAVRGVQELEDQIKLAVRNRLSELLEARESIGIQAASLAVAERRVQSTNLFLEAGRAEIRDVLEAQDALISAQNALTSALVSYRLGELTLQRDLGVLEVNEQGLWREYFVDEAAAVGPEENGPDVTTQPSPEEPEDEAERQ